MSLINSLSLYFVVSFKHHEKRILVKFKVKDGTLMSFDNPAHPADVTASRVSGAGPALVRPLRTGPCPACLRSELRCASQAPRKPVS